MTGQAARWQNALLAAALAAFILAWAAHLGGDANWDLRNYHLYNPFALLHGKIGYDLAPAQVQSFHAPTLDIPFYVLQSRIRSVSLLNTILAIPHAIAAMLAYVLAVRGLDARTGVMRLAAGLATAIGVTGAATLPVVASTMSDMPAVALILAALVMLTGAKPPTVWGLMLAGGLVGAAGGLKLTLAYTGMGLVMAVFVSSPDADKHSEGGHGAGGRWRAVLPVAIGGVAGFLLAAGWWHALLWRWYDNPLFPYFNNVFHSPFAPPVSFQDHSYLPSQWWQWFVDPLILAIQPRKLMTELPVRDPRFALAVLAAIGLVTRALWSRAARGTPLFLAVFFLTGFILWEKQFSILRYLSGLELLTGVIVAAALAAMIRPHSPRRQIVFLLAMLASAVLIEADTIAPEWDRATPVADARPIAVTMPRVAPDALVLLLDASPMAYLAVFQPRTARFIGANNNLSVAVADGLHDWPQTRIRNLIAAQSGEIWGLDMPAVAAGVGDAALAFYGLQRGPCVQVQSNLDWSLTRMCRLEKK